LVVVRPKDRSVEQQLARIASKNHGVVTRRDLARAGITGAEIKHRVGVGALIRVHWGVYRVGHRAPSLESRYLAAVRACGEEAVLSGRAAGYYLGILKGGPPPPEVTGPTERRVRGVKTRRSLLDPRDITVVRGIAVTTVPRTLVDLAAVLDEDDLVRAYHEADVRYRTTPMLVEGVLERCPTAPGQRKLRRVIWGDIPVLLGRLESRFMDELRGAGLPLPETNRPAGTKRVDCGWPDHGLTVELLSYRFHRSRYAWEQDHVRRRQARKRGDAFRTYTWYDVFDDPAPMLDELRELLT